MGCFDFLYIIVYVGIIKGGMVFNIIFKMCEFLWEFCFLLIEDVDVLFECFYYFVEIEVLFDLKVVSDECEIVIWFFVGIFLFVLLDGLLVEMFIFMFV